MNILTLLDFVTSKQPKNKRCLQNSIKSVATTNTTHQECTSQDAPTIRTNSFLQTEKKKFSSTSPLLFLSTPEKHDKSFGLQVSLIWHENTFQHYQVKRLRISTRTNLRRYISIIHDFFPERTIIVVPLWNPNPVTNHTSSNLYDQKHFSISFDRHRCIQSRKQNYNSYE